MTQNKTKHVYTEFLQNCPGLVGDIARYIDSRSPIYQPGLALGSALTLVSALKSGKIESVSTGVSPSIYTCIIAQSGSGKSVAQQLCINLAYKAGAADSVMGKPASDSGLISALQAKKKFLVWDEFGSSLAAYTQSKSSHEALIVSTLMDVYSCTGKRYLGKEYSTRGSDKKEREDIEEVYLSVFGACTPTTFFKSMSEDFVHSGFLSRWLVFFGEDKIKYQSKKPIDDFNIIEGLKDIINPYREYENEQEDRRGGNLSFIPRFESKLPIAFDESNLFRKLSVISKEFTDKHENSPPNSIDSIYWSRANVSFIKVCLCLAKKDFVTYEDIGYAADLVTYLTESMISKSKELLFDNNTQRKEQSLRNRILSLIPSGELVSRSTLSSNLGSAASRQEKNTVISDLLDDGLIEEILLYKDGSQKASKFYKLSK